MARLILTRGRTGDLPADRREELDDAFDRHSRSQIPEPPVITAVEHCLGRRELKARPSPT
ncbi:MAG: hypothetical protein JF597_05490 [Streptomyces sp.]|jgi:hypothetical protein|uniref:hypothetical protein n=1 Tax=Streptomyces sp. TaxID=1931 RepID=UPI0025FAE6E1|nr:hypothetical protein [Streptomyces sp.]MBW8793047.1 hypothetical protein [Streptomyces sp.]